MSKNSQLKNYSNNILNMIILNRKNNIKLIYNKWKFIPDRKLIKLIIKFGHL